MIIMLFWFMLDVNNFGPMTYYSFKSDRQESARNCISPLEPLECYKMILLNLEIKNEINYVLEILVALV